VTVAAAVDRTLAPPSRRTAELIANEQVGAYRLLRAADREGPADPRPGQFYMLAAESEWGGGDGERPYLPRAFSFARVRAGAGGAPELDFLLEAIGPGTERLALLEPGEGLRLVGPLGRGFEPPPAGSRPLLVGGGIGTAPLLCLQDELGPEAEAMLGFRSAAHARAAELFAGDPVVATDDGSVGQAGFVTDLLQERLVCDRPGAAGNPSAPAVFACGPPAMLEAVRALCAEAELPAQLALESGMACGFGACFGCVVPTREGYLRLCVDGPVVEAERLESALFAGAGH
jgi:dihydroorotate dehydrogenase electron transfer subunit